MDWNAILTHHYNRTLPRAIEIEAEYQLHKQICKELFEGFVDYIKERYIDPLEPYMLVPNRYPYHISEKYPEIRHDLFWVNPNATISRGFAQIICEKRYPNREFFIFENPPENKSIPEVQHYHVFSRPKSPQISRV